MPQISIVVPVYKIKETYLRECVDSLVNQTFQDIEIILVDDGSPDRCGQICDEYAERDKRVKVIHQENQGVSAARNAGIDKASGKWLTFVDADDWIELNTCDVIIKEAERMQVDILHFTGYKEWLNKKKENHFPIKEKVLFSKEQKKQIYINTIYPHTMFSLGATCCTLFRMEMVKKGKFVFLEEYILGEDRIFQMECAIASEKIVYLDMCLYHYRTRASSVANHFSHNFSQNAEKYIKRIFEILTEEELLKDWDILQAFYILVFLSLQMILSKQIWRTESSLPYREKIKISNALVKKPPFNEALQNIDPNKLSAKRRICVFLFKNRMYMIWYILKQGRDLLSARKTFE